MGYLDASSHIEDEDLVDHAHGGGLHYQAARFGYRHEETCDVGVSDRHWSAMGNLLAEARNHAAIGAEDVSEACGDELCAPLTLAFLHRAGQ